MPPATLGAVVAVLFLSSLVSGLSGFAFSAVAAGVLWLLPPLQAIPLIMLLSTSNQLVSAGSLRRHMRLVPPPGGEGALPYIAGGVAGIPLGLHLLRHVPAGQFTVAFGTFLLGYGAILLLKPASLRTSATGWRPAVLIGAAGGVVGGLTAFPGALPTMWLGLRGTGKDEARGTVQPYILTLQILSLAGLAATAPQVFDRTFWVLWAAALPPVVAGSLVGVGLYRRMSETNFRRATYLLLAVSGASLMGKGLLR